MTAEAIPTVGAMRRLIDAGPFRFTQIQGPHRPYDERHEVGRLLRLRGFQPPRCEFALEDVPVIDLIESLIVEAHLERELHELWDYEPWRSDGAPEPSYMRSSPRSTRGAGKRPRGHTPRLLELESLYAHGAAVDPLVAVERDYPLSSGDKALIVIDGRHRMFAAARVGVDGLPVFRLVRADAVFSH